jgi:outer membrane protein
MRKNFVFLFCFFISFTFSSGGWARELTLQDAIALAVKTNPELLKSESEKKKASATFDKYKGALFPEISLRGSTEIKKESAIMNGSPTADLDSQKTYTAAVDFTQPLFTGGKMLGGLRLGRALENGAEQSFYTTRQSVVRQVVEAFYKLAEAQDDLVAAQENAQILESYSKITQRYEKIGRSRNIDRMLAGVNLSLGKFDIQDSSQNREEAEASLKKLLSLETEKSIDPKFTVQVQSLAKISVDEALAMAEKNNPEIRAALFKLDEVKATNQVDMAEDLPSLSLTGSSGYQSPDTDELTKDHSDFYTLGLTLKVPLFSGLSSVAKRREHHEAYYEAERDLEIKRKDIREQLDTNLASAQKLYDQLVNVQEVVKQSRKALDLANAGFNRGTVSSTDIISFQKNRYESEKRFVKTQYDYLRAVLQVRELLGTDLERVYAQAK